jgi:hypothetical protein
VGEAVHSRFSALAASVENATQNLRCIATSPVVLNTIVALVSLSLTVAQRPPSVGVATVQITDIKASTRRRDRPRLGITVRAPTGAGQAHRDDPQRGVDW